MSGGAFDYQESRILAIADELQEHINSEIEIQNDTDFGFVKKTPQFIEELKLTKNVLVVLYTLLHRQDWVLSGDDDEDDYRKRLKQDLQECFEGENLQGNVRFNFKKDEVTFGFKRRKSENGENNPQ